MSLPVYQPCPSSIVRACSVSSTIALAISSCFHEKIRNCTDSLRMFITWSSMKHSMNIVQYPKTILCNRSTIEPNCGKKRQLPTINISTPINTCPNDISRYLLTHAAMISVPPVLPLFKKTMARPVPVIQQPIINDMKSCPSPSTLIKCPWASTGIRSCANFSMK